MSNTDSPSLSVGNYTIEMSSGGFSIFSLSEGRKEWLATAADPEIAMTIVEGLVLVETKRFHYPDSTPVFKSEEGDNLPGFLRTSADKS